MKQRSPPAPMPSADPGAPTADASADDFLRAVAAAPRRSPPGAPAGDPARIGRFEVLGRLGAGGMGIVYRARDVQLGRIVALKVLPPEVAADEEPRERFLREARAAALPTHANIVVVYEVGEAAGQIYIAMELVDGGTLRGWTGSRAQPWREILMVLLQAGEGLAAAHAAGLVHRDFKPDNVLIGGDGKARVTDFGLARAAADDGAGAAMGGDAPARSPASPDLGVSMTRTGTFVGTPAYMAPEQLRGEPLDARADVFSFCVTLYEALYGDRPFAGHTLADLSDAVRRGRIRRPQTATWVPSPIARVLAEGLRADPSQRIASMPLLLAALRRAASPWRPRGRYALVALALAGAASVVVTPSALRSSRLRREAARWARVVEQAAADPDPLRGTLLLAELGDDAEPPGAVAAALALVHRPVPLAVYRRRRATAAALSPDGTWLAISDDEGVSIAPADGSGPSRVLAAGGPGGDRIEFTPDGRYLVSASVDGTIRLHPLAPVAPPRELRAAEGPVGVRIGAGGTIVVIGLDRGSVSWWRADRERPLGTSAGIGRPVSMFAVDRDGRRVALAEGEAADAPPSEAPGTKGLSLVELGDGTATVRQFAAPWPDARWALPLAFAPDGRRLLVAGIDRSPVLMDPDGAAAAVTLAGRFPRLVTRAAFSSDGAWIATSAREETSVWLQRVSGGEQRVLPAGSGSLLSFSPDGKRLLVAASAGPADLWPIEGDAAPLTLYAAGGALLNGGSWSADGRRLVLVAFDGTVRVFSPEDPAERDVRRGHRALVDSVAFRPDGALVVSASHDGTVRVSPTTAQGPMRPVDEALLQSRKAFHCAEWSPDGTRILGSASDGAVRVWTVDASGAATGPPLALRAGGVNFYCAHFDRDGRRVVGAGSDGLARVWRLDAPDRPVLLRHPRSVEDAAFTPDGQQIATVCGDGMVRLFDAGSGGAPRELAVHSADGYRVDMDPTGARFLTTSFDGAVRFWRLPDGGPLAVRRFPAIQSAAFAPGGARFIAALRTGSVEIWSTDGDAPLLTLRAHGESATSARLSPDGRWLATGSTDRTARLWPLDWHLLRERLRAATSACLPAADRSRFLDEPAAVADTRFAACEHRHGR